MDLLPRKKHMDIYAENVYTVCGVHKYLGSLRITGLADGRQY